ncbi:MAG: hypothetical protein Q8P13_00195 [bacterium]|nr:hypothetical protein [bacterium]
MIRLIHGPDVVSSRTFLLRLREQNPQVVVLDARSIPKHKFLETLEQENLFGNFLIVDWFEEKHFVEGFKSLQQEIVFWSSSTLTNTSWAGKTSFFPIKSVGVFKLTDAFGLRQAKLSQEYLELALSEKNPPEVILSLLSRQLKQISLALSGEAKKVSHSSFVQQKITDQAKLWSEKGIKRAFRSLLEADLAIKSGLEPKFSISLALAKTQI